jgi:cell pole-organizing protein PopZ
LRRLIPVVAPVSAQVAVKAPKPNSDDVVTEVVLRSPLKAPDAAPAAKAEPARVEKAGPPNGAAPTPAADAKPAATAPPAEDKPALAVKPGPSVTMSEAAPVTPGIGKSMEDTVVELLRPLLREWLDKNMPRLIEPALKAELEALRDVIDKGRQD